MDSNKSNHLVHLYRRNEIKEKILWQLRKPI